MNKIVDYIQNKLRELGINKNYSKEILELTNNKFITDEMSLRGAYSAFLLNMSQDSTLFKNILKNEYIFDLEFIVESDLFDEIIKYLENIPEFEYIHYEPYYLNANIDDNNVISVETDKNINNTKSNITSEILDKEIDNFNKLDCKKYFIGIKYKNTIYQNSKIEPYYYPYFLMKKYLRYFNFLKPTFKIESNINTNNNIKILFLELIEHLKSLNLPLKITDFEINFENTNITNIYNCFLHFEESNWPKDENAVKCSKSAFYCYLYQKSNFRFFISEDFCTFFYKKIFFNIKILLKRDLNTKYKILKKIDTIYNNRNKDNFIGYYNIKLLKLVLKSYYPVHFDDFFIDIICLMISQSVIGVEKFIDEFFKKLFYIYECSISGNCVFFNLDILKIEKRLDIKVIDPMFKVGFDEISYCVMINKSIIEEIKFKYENILFSEYENLNVLNNSLKDLKVYSILNDEYSFILSKEKIENSEEILGNNNSLLDLNTPDIYSSVIFKYIKDSRCYYDVQNNMLVVKVFKPENIDLISNIFINFTSFNYIKFNKDLEN